jgi:hypothetical protein
LLIQQVIPGREYQPNAAITGSVEGTYLVLRSIRAGGVVYVQLGITRVDLYEDLNLLILSKERFIEVITHTIVRIGRALHQTDEVIGNGDRNDRIKVLYICCEFDEVGAVGTEPLLDVLLDEQLGGGLSTEELSL